MGKRGYVSAMVTVQLEREWLTIGETASYLQVSKDTVRRWLAAGKLRGAQMMARGAVRISAVSVEKMLERSQLAGNAR